MSTVVSENQRQDLRMLIIPIERTTISKVVVYTLRQETPLYSL